MRLGGGSGRDSEIGSIRDLSNDLELAVLQAGTVPQCCQIKLDAFPESRPDFREERIPNGQNTVTLTYGHRHVVQSIALVKDVDLERRVLPKRTAGLTPGQNWSGSVPCIEEERERS